MENNTDLSPKPAVPDAKPSASLPYEAPCIETVLTPDDLEREVFYAGAISGSGTV